jgi:hypothetical protein
LDSGRSHKVEIEAHGAWLPGSGANLGAGLGLNAVFGWASVGAEVWHYKLALKDDLSGELREIETTNIVPLLLGARLRLSQSLVFEAMTGLGVNLAGTPLKTGYCSEKGYGGWLLVNRVLIGFSEGPLTFGPHIGLIHAFGGLGSSSGCATGPDPDPERRKYPHELPFGVQLGLSLSLGYP